MYNPGDTVVIEFATSLAGGSASNADSLPAAIVNRNGTDDLGVAVAVSNIDAGRYTASFTIPASYVAGDSVNLSITSLIGGITVKAVKGPIAIANLPRVDGIPYARYMKSLVSFFGGKTTYTDNNDNTFTLQFLAQDGVTVVLTITASKADGHRTTAIIT